MIQIIDLGSGSVDRTAPLNGHSCIIRSVEYAADGRTLAAVCDHGKASLLSAHRYPAYENLEGHEADVWALDVSPDGRYIASGSLDQTAKIWEMETGRLINTIHAHFPVVTLAFTADGQHLVTTADRNSAKVWPVSGGEADLELSGHGASVVSVAVDPRGRWIATGSRDQRARLWDSGTGELLRIYPEGSSHVTSLAFSPDGERLAIASKRQHATVRETLTGRQLCHMTGPKQEITKAVFSPDGLWLATASQDGFARIWDAATGEAIGSPMKGGSNQMRWIAFSPDGKRLLTNEAGMGAAGLGKAGNKVELWDIDSRRRLWDFSPHNAPTFAMCFSPDGRRIITGGGDNTVRIWSAFPWMPEDYPETDSSSMESRLELFKRDYWSQTIEQTPSSNRRITSYGWGEKNTSRHVKVISSPSRPVAPRPSDAGDDQIDLSTIYNAALNEVWQPVHDYFHLDLDLAALSPGKHLFEGLYFDIRGVIQLRLNDPRWMQFPASVDIPINRKIQKFHVVHSAVYYQPQAGEGPTIGTYRLHYEDGGNAIKTINYGIHLRTFLGASDPRTDCERSNLVWQWRKPTSRRSSSFRRLFKATYENPRPNERVTHIEFRSADTHTAPFLVGLTME
jgi:WD40 repeat protein